MFWFFPLCSQWLGLDQVRAESLELVQASSMAFLKLWLHLTVT